jgi:hypothetical protein
MEQVVFIGNNAVLAIVQEHYTTFIRGSQLPVRTVTEILNHSPIGICHSLGASDIVEVIVKNSGTVFLRNQANSVDEIREFSGGLSGQDSS